MLQVDASAVVPVVESCEGKEQRDDEAAARTLLARFDRCRGWPWPRRVIVIVGLGFFFAFFDIITIGLSLESLQKEFSVTKDTADWAVSVSLIGYVIGSFLDSRISDLYGRKVSLTISMALVSGGSALTASAWEFWVVMVARFITGMGIGADIAQVTAYMNEMCPLCANNRGRYTSMAIACGFAGFSAVSFVGPSVIPEADYGWRLLFGMGACGGIALLFTRRHLPRSPRWLIERGQFKAARDNMKRASQEVFPAAEPGDGAYGKKQASVQFGTLFTSPHLGRLIMFSLIWFFYYIGNYAYLELADGMYADLNFSLGSLWLTGVTACGFTFGSIVSIFVSDKFERLYSCAVVAAVWSVLMFLIGWYPSEPMVICAGICSTMTISLLIPLLYVLTGEQFPTSVRATGVSLTDGIGHIGGALAPQIINGISDAIGGSDKTESFRSSFSTMGCTGLVALVLLLSFGASKRCGSFKSGSDDNEPASRGDNNKHAV